MFLKLFTLFVLPFFAGLIMENETAVNDSMVASAAELGCPSYSDEAAQQVELFSFWVEGVSQVSIFIFIFIITG